jgi:polyphosphate kinase 2 (PPK2 family)
MAKGKARPKEDPKEDSENLATEVANVEVAATEERTEPVARPAKKVYRKELVRLQLDMLKVQAWVVGEQLRAVVLLEGLGPAGKIGCARRICEGMAERMCHAVTLDPPEKRESSKWQFQRYVEHFPPAGKITIFDGSWYHVAATQRALGISSEAEFARFLHSCAEFEQTLINTGVTLIKHWFTAGDEEQERRFRTHMTEFGKQNPYLLKAAPPTTPVKVAAVMQAVIAATDITPAPWYIVRADDKRNARLNCMRHLLSLVPTSIYDEPKAKAKASTRK